MFKENEVSVSSVVRYTSCVSPLPYFDPVYLSQFCQRLRHEIWDLPLPFTVDEDSPQGVPCLLRVVVFLLCVAPC